MQVAVDLVAAVVHRGKVAARNERDLVAMAAVILDDLFADGLVIGPLVPQRQPGKGPGHPPAREAPLKAVAEPAHRFDRVEGSLILARIVVPADFDLIDAHHGVEG